MDGTAGKPRARYGAARGTSRSESGSFMSRRFRRREQEARLHEACVLEDGDRRELGVQVDRPCVSVLAELDAANARLGNVARDLIEGAVDADR